MDQKAIISVHLFRYKESDLEFLMIKRATLGYNWQCVTGALERGESPLEFAIRKIFEETGYIPVLITPISFHQEYYTKKEGQGDV